MLTEKSSGFLSECTNPHSQLIAVYRSSLFRFLIVTDPKDQHRNPDRLHNSSLRVPQSHKLVKHNFSCHGWMQNDDKCGNKRSKRVHRQRGARDKWDVKFLEQRWFCRYTGSGGRGRGAPSYTLCPDSALLHYLSAPVSLLLMSSCTSGKRDGRGI